MKKAIGYIRCSTEDQQLGPEAQRATLTRWCQANGCELAATFEEHVSGGAALDKREQLMAAVAALEPGAILLVARRDRLARDTMSAVLIERLVEKAAAQVISADGAGNGDGPEAILMRRMLDAFAEYERALIRVRTRAALAVKKARHERTGGVPFGFTVAADGKQLAEEPEEQKTLAMVRELRAGGLSLRAIAADLEARGRLARNGKRFSAQVISSMLQAA